MAAAAESAPPAPADAASSPVPPSPPPAPAPAPPRGLIAQFQEIVRELPGLLSDRIELFVLELQRATQALAQVVVMVIIVAIVAATAWLAFWGGVLSVLVDMGWSLPLALAAVMLINLLAAAMAVLRLRRLLPLLSLPATRRHMNFAPARVPVPEATGTEEPSPDPASDHANRS